MAMIDLLHTEHAEIRDVLDVFEEQIGALTDDTGELELDVMRDAVEFLAKFPDNVHRDGEKLIYRLMMERDPDCHDLISSLSREHDELCRRAELLMENVEDICEDVLVPKDEFAQRASAFVALQREHIHSEDRDLLPRARQALRPEDWRAIARRLQERGEPIPHLGNDQKLYALEYRLQQRASV
ncbi:MAG: hemerythrin domain-containing protein [Ectothiorhodospiraceae bacterium]|jgi:hemerythrin-like domain-containing protein